MSGSNIPLMNTREQPKDDREKPSKSSRIEWHLLSWEYLNINNIQKIKYYSVVIIYKLVIVQRESGRNEGVIIFNLVIYLHPDGFWQALLPVLFRATAFSSPRLFNTGRKIFRLNHFTFLSLCKTLHPLRPYQIFLY